MKSVDRLFEIAHRLRPSGRERRDKDPFARDNGQRSSLAVSSLLPSGVDSFFTR
jgi:hypothetical protein